MSKSGICPISDFSFILFDVLYMIYNGLISCREAKRYVFRVNSLRNNALKHALKHNLSFGGAVFLVYFCNANECEQTQTLANVSRRKPECVQRNG